LSPSATATAPLREQFAQRTSFDLQLAGHRRQAARHPALHVGSSATDNCFAQPIVSYPGIGPEMTLMDISTYPPVIVNAPGSGAPLNTTFAVPSTTSASRAQTSRYAQRHRHR